MISVRVEMERIKYRGMVAVIKMAKIEKGSSKSSFFVNLYRTKSTPAEKKEFITRNETIPRGIKREKIVATIVYKGLG